MPYAKHACSKRNGDMSRWSNPRASVTLKVAIYSMAANCPEQYVVAQCQQSAGCTG